MISGAWVEGFVTAAGAFDNAMREADRAAMRPFVNQSCTQNPLKTMDDAAYALVLELKRSQ